MKKIINAIQQFDIFAPSIFLRFRSENSYKTLTSAIISLFIIIAFVTIFYNQFISLLLKENINSTIIYQQNINPDEIKLNTNQIMFALSLNNIDMVNLPSYFDIYINQINKINSQNTITNISLQPCTRDQWNSYGQLFGDYYDQLGFSTWLCPSPNQTLTLTGRSSSTLFKYVNIQVTQCTGILNSNGCMSQAQINTYINQNEAFYFNFYFINTLVNPNNQVPTSKFLQDSISIPFSLTQGMTTNLNFNHVNIQSDQTFWPFQRIISQEVNVAIVPPQSLSYPNQGQTTQYLKFYLKRGTENISISRNFTKIDTLFSYLGGLFSLVIIFFQFPLNFYNICCYELNLANTMFIYKNQNAQDLQNPQNPKNQQLQFNKHSVQKFNFCIYIGYLFYALLRKIGINLKCKTLQIFYKSIGEVRKQVDVSKIIQRFVYLDRFYNLILDQHQKKLIHLYRKPNISDIQIYRKRFNIYQKLKKQQKKQDQLINNVLNVFFTTAQSQIKRRQGIKYQIKQSIQNLKQRDDILSKKILQNIDPIILRKFLQLQTQSDINVNKDNQVGLEQYNQQNKIELEIHNQLNQTNQRLNKKTTDTIPQIQLKMISVNRNKLSKSINERNVQQNKVETKSLSNQEINSF